MQGKLENGWAIVSNSEKPSWQQECDEQWLDRCLGLPQGTSRQFFIAEETDRVSMCSLPDGEVYHRLLAHTRVEVLRSLMERFAGNPFDYGYQQNDGVALVITNSNASKFLITKKDDTHPNPKCKQRYCLMGGNRDKGETFRSCVLRELYEEIRDMDLADSIASNLRTLNRGELPSVQWPGNYRVDFSVAVAPYNLYEQWKHAWLRPGSLSEGYAVEMHVEQFHSLFRKEQTAPGTHFIASHGFLIQKALNALR